MFGKPSFVTIGRSVRELLSGHPKSPKTRKSVAIRETVSDHSAPAGRWRGGGALGGAGRALGGEVAERMVGGGGARSRSRIAGSGGRAADGSYRSSGGYRPGGRRRRANEDDRSCQDGVCGSCCSHLGLNY